MINNTMCRKYQNGFISFLLIPFLFCSCDEEAKPKTKAEAAIELLCKGDWHVSSIQVDGFDRSDLFENFSLTFTKTGYTTTGTTPVWPRTGAWSFTNSDEPDQFMREDEVKVDIISLEEDSLTLELTWTKQTIVGGRLQSIKGKHVFVLIH
jgi:hypothetical protein